MELLGTLLSFGADSWIIGPISSIFLFIDGIVFSLVAYSYQIFEIMKTLNYTVILSKLQYIVDRINSLIIVFILFKVGKALLGFMMNPENAARASSDLIKNIMICLALLVSYTTIFGIMDEVSLLIVGPGDYSDWKYIKSGQDSEDSGLIYRLIFGDAAKSEDTGKSLALIVLHVFLHGKDNNNSEAEQMFGKLLSDASDSETDGTSAFDLKDITDLSDNMGRTVVYRWPLVSTVVGVYMIVTLVTLSIEVGVRMLKLFALRLLAPVAIVGIADGGPSNSLFSGYVKTYMEVFMQVFFRIAMFYLTMALLVILYNSILGNGTSDGIKSSALLQGIKASTEGQPPVVTTAIVFILILVALFKFLKDLPNMIDSLGIFNFNLGDSKGGLGSFMKAGLGGIGGYALGSAMGSAQGIANGQTLGQKALGAITGGLSGGVSGAASGGRGENVVNVMRNATASAGATAAAGGLVRRGLNTLNERTGINQIKSQNIDNKIKQEDAAINKNNERIDANNLEIDKSQQIVGNIEAAENAAAAEISTEQSSYKDEYGRAVEYGSSDSEYVASMTERDTGRIAQIDHEVEAFKSKAATLTADDVAKIKELRDERRNLTSDTRKDELREEWKTKRDGAKALQGHQDRATREKAKTSARQTIESKTTENKGLQQDNKLHTDNKSTLEKQKGKFNAGVTSRK